MVRNYLNNIFQCCIQKFVFFKQFWKTGIANVSINCKFDIISLSETWISKKSNSVFYPRKINGCSKYIRQGSWFYISTHPKSHPRKDLNLHFYDNNFEFECEWTESLNKNKLNTLTATTFRHPHKNDFFWFKFLFPFLSKFTTELLNSKT